MGGFPYGGVTQTPRLASGVRLCLRLDECGIAPQLLLSEAFRGLPA